MNLLGIGDISKVQILKIFKIADEAKAGKLRGLLDGRTLSLLFEKPSTRTRVSFEAAMLMLGGTSVYLDSQRMHLSRGETYGDTAKVLSLYTDFIAARLFDHSNLLEMARVSSVPVINALTDMEHPCQALSDLYTIRDAKGLNGVRVAFIGDVAANTANSLMLCASKLGLEVSMVGPEGAAPNQKFLKSARKLSKVEVSDDIREGLSGADVVYTDTWVSMGQEAAAKKRVALFRDYQLNKAALGYAKKTAIVMHCLPAHRGEEITSEVLDGKRSVVWEQARNKMFIEAAILVYLYESVSARA